MTNRLYDRLFARHEAAKTPFLHLPDGTVLTHGQFLERAGQFANALAAHGLSAGDRIAVQIPKSPDALALYAACVKSGIVLLPLNVSYTAAEVSYFLGDSGAKLFLASPDKADALRPVAAEAHCPLETLGTDGAGSLAQQADQRSVTSSVTARSGDDLAALLYTSGTTGRSKGAMLTQDNLLSNAEVLTEFWGFTASDCLQHALPIFHTHGLFVATNVALLSGAAMRFYPGFDADALIRDMPNSTALMGVPTFYTRLLDQPGFTQEVTANMRLFISGSAPLLAETHRQFEERTGQRILERYGMTETNMNTSNPLLGERRAGTVGRPLPGVDLKVCDEAGKEITQGEIGTIEVRGPNVFKGYWQMPEKTAQELRPDGFFITGDLGFVDVDGYVTIVGRGKDLIISGGFNIYPKEVEAELDAQPGILESAVIGVPHPDLGEATVGVLVPDGSKVLDELELQEAMTKALARFKHPRALVVVKELPRNTMGKVQKNLLRKQLNETFTA